MTSGGARPTGSRRALACVLVLAATAALSSRPAQARSDLKPPPPVGGQYQRLQAAGVVDVRQLGRQPSTTRVPVPNHPVLRHAKSPAPSIASGVRNAQPLAPTGLVEEQLTVFPGIGLASGISALGASQNAEPPDTQIAVGPDKVLEMVNNNMTTWSKAGARLSIADLQAFYPVPGGFTITDPRVIFDASSGRFIATAFAIDAAYDSRVYLAVSQTSDPGGLWSQWLIRSTVQVITDQPKVGVSDDKVAISWAEGVPTPCPGQSAPPICFVGEVTVVVQKSDVIAVPPMAQPHTFVWGPDLTRFGIVPVQSISPTTTQYLVYNNADPYFAVENQCAQTLNALYGNCPTLGIIAVTGTPAGGNIAFDESADPPIPSTTAPPDAPQSGTTALISSGDDRLVSAVYQYNRIWTTATDGNYCSTVNPTLTPPGSCLLVLMVWTDPALSSQNRNWVLGGTGDYAFYPAIGLDLAGRAFVTFSRSNSGISPGAWMTGASGGSSSGWDPWAVLAAGTGKYETTQPPCGGGHNRWGDYSGAAVDPTDPTDVWVAAEYSAASGTNTCLWGTVIARLTYSAPTVTSVTPQLGTAGTSTVITGTDFVAGATTVLFGLQPASAVNVQTPNRLTATAPTGSGLVSLAASTADGQGPPGAQFKYPRVGAPAAVLPQRTSPPARGSAPPRVPASTAGPRPLVTISSPLADGQDGWLTSKLWMSIQLAVQRLLRFVLSA